MMKSKRKLLIIMAIVFGLSSMNFAETVDAIGTHQSENEAFYNIEERLNNEGFPLLESYSLDLPDQVTVADMQYNRYDIGYYYVVALSNAVNIRKEPTTDSPVVKQLGFYGKMNAFEKVKGQYFTKSDSDEWYRVYWYENQQIKTGYVFSKIVAFRSFRFDVAKEKIEHLETFFETHQNMGKVNNYKNYNGRPPLHNGSTTDDYGYDYDQSAPLYQTASTKSDFRYVLDGMIFNIERKEGNFYYVYVPDFDFYGYMPAKYVSSTNQVKNLSQVVVVDLKNQNIFALDKIDDLWYVRSLSFATSGKEAKYKEPTVPGYYAAIQKKDKFLYLDDETSELDGYAPFAIRFNGGAYLHGFPVNYEWNTVDELVQDAVYDEQGLLVQEAVYETKRVGSPIDPGHIEYSYTLGTVPLSHKCIRNPTSHAEYMYNWIKLNEAIILVIE